MNAFKISKSFKLTENIQDTCDILNSLLNQAKERGVRVNVDIIDGKNNELDGTFNNLQEYQLQPMISAYSRSRATN